MKRKMPVLLLALGLAASMDARASNVFIITVNGGYGFTWDRTPVDATIAHSRSQWILSSGELQGMLAGSVIFGIGLDGVDSVMDDRDGAYVHFANTEQTMFAGTAWEPLGTQIWQGRWGHPYATSGWWGESSSAEGWAFQNTGNDFLYLGHHLLVTVGSDSVEPPEADAQQYLHYTSTPDVLLRYRDAASPPGANANEGPLDAAPATRLAVHSPRTLADGATLSDSLPAGQDQVNMYVFSQASTALATIETAPGAGMDEGDTRMWLYDDQGVELDFDDDGGADLYSQISIVLDPGTYFVKIDEFGRDASLEYDVTFSGPDTDDDGVPDSVDNCPTDMNAGQEDADSDGYGDVCDNCPRTENPDQSDLAGLGSATPDGVGDACQNADFNADGEVDILDATLLRRALIGLEPTLDPAMPPNP